MAFCILALFLELKRKKPGTISCLKGSSPPLIRQRVRKITTGFLGLLAPVFNKVLNTILI